MLVLLSIPFYAFHSMRIIIDNKNKCLMFLAFYSMHLSQ